MPRLAPSSSNPSRRAIGATVVTGIAGALCTLLVADAVIRMADLNNYAGLLSERVWFRYIPLGSLAGAVVGFASTVLGRSRSWWHNIGIALSLVAAGAFVGGGLVYFAADKPPKIGGKPLILELEVRVPETIRLPEPLTESGFYPWIFETPNAKWWTHVDLEQIVRSGSDTMIPCHARLRSSRATGRFIEVGFGGTGEHSQRVPLPVARPSCRAGQLVRLDRCGIRSARR